jgi:hypothetical protein
MSAPDCAGDYDRAELVARYFTKCLMAGCDNNQSLNGATVGSSKLDGWWCPTATEHQCLIWARPEGNCAVPWTLSITSERYTFRGDTGSGRGLRASWIRWRRSRGAREIRPARLRRIRRRTAWERRFRAGRRGSASRTLRAVIRVGQLKVMARRVSARARRREGAGLRQARLRRVRGSRRLRGGRSGLPPRGRRFFWRRSRRDLYRD